MKKICSILFLLIMIFGTRAYAQETALTDTSQEAADMEEVPSEEAYQFPVIPPAATLFGGYSIVNLDGSPTADEYEYLHDSITLGGELKIFSFPHRLHLDIDFRNKNDYFGDISYAYRDMVLFRGINRTLWHNLDNILLVVPAPTATQSVDVRDAGVNYGVKWSINSAFLRFKTPDYPFHIYLDGNIIDKDGTMQQRFLGGSGFFNDLVRTSESRSIDWETKQLTVGSNTHLGPVEIDVSHGEKRFDSDGNNVLSDFYEAGGGRNAGIYQHNLVPDLKSSSSTIKLHTSYTGRIVASATFSKSDLRNNGSDSTADYFIGAGEVTWTAATNLAVFVKYRHKEADIDNPSTVTVTDLPNPASISSISDMASATVRYRPFSGLTLRGEYHYDHIRRENAQDWDLPEKTEHNIASLSADMRIIRNLNLRAGYTYTDINDPAYNVEPDHSNAGNATISWTPSQKIISFVSYSAAKEKRDDLNTVNGPDAKNRDVFRTRAMGVLTYLITEKVSLTASYSYIHDKIHQDLVVGATLQPDVPDSTTANSYGLTMNYIPSNRIDLSGAVSYTVSSGSFSLTNPDSSWPISIGSLSALKTKETDCSLSGQYHFKNGFSAGVQYRYIDFNDVLDNPWDDVQDGRVHIVLLILSKKW
jgi:predicted porin